MAKIKQIFVNLHVKNLKKSVDFFTKLGFKFNPKFTDETATCMIINDSIFAMLIIEKKFKEFSKKDIPDTKKTSEVLLALSFENQKAVDIIMQKALDAGAKIHKEAKEEYGMYGGSFKDLDGHIWEVFYMGGMN